MTAKVYHADLWGLREVREDGPRGEKRLVGGKYHWLYQNDANSTRWTSVEPQSPFYLLIPQDSTGLLEYEALWRVPGMFGTGDQKRDSGTRYGLGICTHNDLLHVGYQQSDVERRIEVLADDTIPDSCILETLPVKESRYWNTSRERAKVRGSQWRQNIWPIYYRPFDWRTIYYEPALMEIGRGGASKKVMTQAKNCRLNFLCSKGYEIDKFEHVLVCNAVAVHHAATRKEGNYVFPLYVSDTPEKNDLFSRQEPTDFRGAHRANLAPEFLQEVSRRLKLRFIAHGKGDLKKTFGPEDVFHYMYGAFHSPTYRSRYAEFLKIDFPRLPLTSRRPLFRALCGLGEELVGLHLMEKHGPRSTQYPVAGDNRVEKVRYTEPGQGAPTGRVWINKTQHFEGVPPEVWQFHVGGYQVCQKWLKDRKGRQLTYDDLSHYQNVVSALSETIRLMARIDETIDQHGGWPIQ